MTVRYQELVESVATTADVDTRVARAAAEATLTTLARALRDADRERLLAALPAGLLDDLPATGGPQDWDERAFVREVSLLGRCPLEQARLHAQAVLAELAEQEPDLMPELRLPDDVKALFTRLYPGGALTDSAPLTPDEIAGALETLPDWTGDTRALRRTIALPPGDLDRVLARIDALRDEMDRTPTVHRDGDAAELVVHTAAVGGVTALDVELAVRIDDAIADAAAGMS